MNFKTFIERKELRELETAESKVSELYRNKKTTLLQNNWKEIELPSPPKNDSKETEKELINIISNIKKNTNKCWQSIKDQDICDIEDIFFNKLKSLGIKLNVKDKHKIIRLAKDVAIVSFYFKEKYKRPRPFKLSKFYGMKIDNVGKTTDSPSYPSSHATVGKFLALYLADKFPEHKKQIMKTGIEIGENRVKAGFHFPSDVKIGFYLAEKLWENLNDNK